MVDENDFHPCIVDQCDNTVAYDDEPACYSHSPSSGSHFPGYSYKDSQRPSNYMEKILGRTFVRHNLGSENILVRGYKDSQEAVLTVWILDQNMVEVDPNTEEEVTVTITRL